MGKTKLVNKIGFRKPGDHSVHRGVYNGKVWIARPVVVVEDRPEIIKLLITPGSICKFTTGLKTRKYRDANSGDVLPRWDEQLSMDWDLYDHKWFGKRVLIINRPDEYYSIQLHWEYNTDRFLGWYINFELPLVRSVAGFDTLDLELDLLVRPDFSIEWKDVEEYKAGVKRNVITQAQVNHIESAKEKIFCNIHSHHDWFKDQNLIQRKPPSDWTIPQLSSDWDMTA